MVIPKNVESGGGAVIVNIPAPIITREHGSWAVLFVPMIVGSAYATEFSWNVLLLGFSALGVFMSYVPVHTILREFTGEFRKDEKFAAALFWSTVYLGTGVVFIVPLLLQGYWYLLPIGITGLCSFFGNYLLTKTVKKSVVSDLVAIAGLTLSAPSAYYVSTGELGENALVLWALNALFFGCSVFYVHMKIRVSGMKKESWRWSEKIYVGSMNILYHIAVIVIVAVIVLYHMTPHTVILAFIPMFIHAIVGTVNLHRRTMFKHLGFLLLAQSVVFAIILVISISHR
jgi:hypothetical protein